MILMSAFPPKADIIEGCEKGLLLTQSGHSISTKLVRAYLNDYGSVRGADLVEDTQTIQVELTPASIARFCV